MEIRSARPFGDDVIGVRWVGDHPDGHGRQPSLVPDAVGIGNLKSRFGFSAPPAFGRLEFRRPNNP